jgi:hypothetical protein
MTVLANHCKIGTRAGGRSCAARTSDVAQPRPLDMSGFWVATEGKADIEYAALSKVP